MQLIDDGSVRARNSNGHPKVVELVCPHCLVRGGFEPEVWHELRRLVVVAEVPCPACTAPVMLLQRLDRNEAPVDGGLYIHPPTIAREPLAGVDYLRDLAAPLGRTYESALKLYNQGEWPATAITLRHLLEGLTKRLLGPDKRDLPLSAQLEALSRGDIDLARPLQHIGPLLASNGPIGQQFDDEAMIDHDTAEQLLRLTEHVVTYLVVLPGLLADLKTQIGAAPVPLRRDDVVDIRVGLERAALEQRSR